VTGTKEFVDRRSQEEKDSGLATPILFWYDLDCDDRRRVNGIAITVEGLVVVAEAICSRKDQFIKAKGRMIVSKRLMGRAKKHCQTIMPCVTDVENMATACAQVYSTLYRLYDEKGAKRAYNAGLIFSRKIEATGSAR